MKQVMDLFAGEDATMMTSRRSVRLRRDPLAFAVVLETQRRGGHQFRGDSSMVEQQD